MRTAVLAVCLLLACAPPEPPSWFVDRPRVWGLMATVVTPGPYSSDLVVPAGRDRAAALPLDTLELRWLEAVPSDTSPRPPPIWLVCRWMCTNEVARPELIELAPLCPDPLPLSRTGMCRLGQGERVPLVLGGVFTAGPDFTGHIPVMAVGTADPDLSPETCLERLLASPQHDLEACLVQSRSLELGPEWKVFAHLPGYADQVVDDVPDDLADEPADVHPVLEAIRVRRVPGGDELLHDGDVVSVRPGDHIRVDAQFSADSAQSFYGFSPAPEPHFYARQDEKLSYESAITALVDLPDGDDAGPVHWIVPDSAEPIDLYLRAADNRQGRAAAIIRFVPEGDRE